MKKKSLIVSTSFLVGAVVFLLLAFLPTINDLLKIKKNAGQDFFSKIPELYNKQGIPDISFSKDGIRANNDQPFYRSWDAGAQGNFHLYVDTGSSPAPDLSSKIRQGAGGIVLLRDKIIFYDAKQNKEQTIPSLSQLPFSFTLNKQTIEKYSVAFGKGFIFLSGITFFLINVFRNSLLLLITGLILSGKGKKCGGGNYSVALWSLVPPGLLQLFLGGGCLRCSLYYVIFIISAMIFSQKLVPEKIED